jgi:tetratricopeptide (TPR) repeat protein
MHALLLMFAAVLGADSRSILNARNLIDHEWSVACTYSEAVYDPISGRTSGTRPVFACDLLTLREDVRWDAGTAWMIQYRKTGEGYRTTAFKGFFQIGVRDEMDVLIVSLGFTKKYTATGVIAQVGMANWSLDTRFQSQGGRFALTLENGNRVPETALELSFEEAFYVDEQGRETVLRSSPVTFSQRIMGEGSIRTLRTPEFATVGATLELCRGDMFQEEIGLKMPPTFNVRAPTSKPHVVMKPTGSTPPTSPSPPLATDPAEAILAKAKEAYEKADYRRAITLCTAALELSPSLTSAIKWRGYAYYELTEYVQAGRDLSDVIKRDPSDSFAYLKRAQAYLQLGYFSRGVSDYTERVRLSPNDPYAFNSLAWVLATCPDSSVRNGKLALVHAEKACQLTDFKNAFCIGTLAAACAETGDFARALRLQAVALELHSDSRKPQATQILRSYENRKPWREHPREGL